MIINTDHRVGDQGITNQVRSEGMSYCVPNNCYCWIYTVQVHVCVHACIMLHVHVQCRAACNTQIDDHYFILCTLSYILHNNACPQSNNCTLYSVFKVYVCINYRLGSHLPDAKTVTRVLKLKNTSPMGEL